jgi:UDP-2-acetamido-2-deoxy-ribo-hexuluronate aminotransferase
MKMPFIDLKSQYGELHTLIKERINSVLDHGQYIMGPEVIELEEKLASYTGSKHCITVSSGTEALLISLMALGVKPGDEVITTPFTFASTAEVIVLLGAKPVFVDIDQSTCNIDASLIRRKITDKTRAIIPVSLYGQTADMDEINQIAVDYKNISVIEDGAQSFGASYKGKKSTNLSHIGCTSFFPSKPLGCYGDGGAIFTNDSDVAAILKQIRIHGQSEKYVYSRIGVGGRMDTIQCAILLAKMERFSWEIDRRLEIGVEYNIFMDSIGVQRVQQQIDRTSVFAQYSIFLENREQAITHLDRLGIPTAIYYPIPLNEQPAYKDLCRPDDVTPIASCLSKKVLSLPMSPYLSRSDQNKVCEALSALVT